QCFNMAFGLAASEASQNNRVFSPPNWIKAKASLREIRAAVRQYIMMSRLNPVISQEIDSLKSSLKMSPGSFSARWAAD
ncbi:MAG: hypothetical protein IJG36_01730, partial [Synergistaceae bacterium]|nr:hypothetical protein [Synergistaceae bacterium]